MASRKSLASNDGDGNDGNGVDDNEEEENRNDCDEEENGDGDQEEGTRNTPSVDSDVDPPGYEHRYDDSYGGFIGGQLEWEEIQRERNENDADSPVSGDKRSHSRMAPAVPLRLPIKVHATTGAKPRAGDYEVAVQTLLAEAIPLYRGYLSTETPYPGPMEEMRWAKRSWKDSCEECDIHMTFNGEIIKLVSDALDWWSVLLDCTHLSERSPIAAHTSVAESKLKSSLMSRTCTGLSQQTNQKRLKTTSSWFVN